MQANGIIDKEKAREAAECAAEKVRCGTYYSEAYDWFHDLYQMPIIERVPLVLAVKVFLIVTLVGLHSCFALLPAKETRALVVPRSGMGEEGFPSLVALTESPMDNPNPAIIEWYIKTYVVAWEQYDIEHYKTTQMLVRGLVAPGLYQRYKEYYLGSDSPYLRYERHTKRVIVPRSVELVDDQLARVEFVAIEEVGDESKKTLWRADITFSYTEIRIDQDTGIVTPMEFQVTDYQVEKIG